MDQVLKGREAGGHLIIVSQGDSRTLSNTDETIIREYENYYSIR